MREDAALQNRRGSLSRRDQRRARQETSPDDRPPPGRAASGSDRVAHTRVVNLPRCGVMAVSEDPQGSLQLGQW